MRHCYRDDVDVVYLISGDGEFLHLVEEVSRSGKKIVVGAFSSGLEPPMRSTVDRCFLFDDLYSQSIAPQIAHEPPQSVQRGS